ncbi:MAG: SMI1/KNR4 family protein [Planctomycetales bacterium]|nr:SMI1/KNR4 family protein [Planctomycetales bacterium]
MVADAEKELGIRFPASYVEALRLKNGGAILGNLVRLPKQDIPQHLRPYVDHGHISVRGINGIGASHTSVLTTPYLIEEWGLPKNLVLLDGDGHWWIAFDYREPTSNPPIVFVESDSGDTLRIADDFATFFDSLVDEEELFDEEGNYVGDQ